MVGTLRLIGIREAEGFDIGATPGQNRVDENDGKEVVTKGAGVELAIQRLQRCIRNTKNEYALQWYTKSLENLQNKNNDHKIARIDPKRSPNQARTQSAEQHKPMDKGGEFDKSTKEDQATQMGWTVIQRKRGKIHTSTEQKSISKSVVSSPIRVIRAESEMDGGPESMDLALDDDTQVMKEKSLQHHSSTNYGVNVLQNVVAEVETCTK